MMHWRRFLGALGVGLLAAPLRASAQPAKRIPIVEYLTTSWRRGDNPNFPAFLEGLREAGHVDGQTVLVEDRSSEGTPERLPTLVAELLQRKPDVKWGCCLHTGPTWRT
jgi:ABC-type sugar transport system substrate-binding protein